MRLSVVVLQRINILTIVHLYNMLLISWTLQDAQKVKRHCNLPITIAPFCFQSKEISLKSYKENRVSKGASRFNFHDIVFAKRGSFGRLNTMSGYYSENPSIDFIVDKTNRSFIFHNSGRTDSPKKVLIPATIIDGRIKDTKVIHKKCSFEQRSQAGTSVVGREL